VISDYTFEKSQPPVPIKDISQQYPHSSREPTVPTSWQAIKAGKTFQFTMLACRQNPKKTLRKTLKNLL
jgi:hypothetical protein